MPYDKYRNWKKQSPSDDEIKGQVIKDLEETVDQTEKLEILDSYEAYVRRDEQMELAEHLAYAALHIVLRPLLVEFAKARMPGATPISRPRMAEQ